MVAVLSNMRPICCVVGHMKLPCAGCGESWEVRGNVRRRHVGATVHLHGLSLEFLPAMPLAVPWAIFHTLFLVLYKAELIYLPSLHTKLA